MNKRVLLYPVLVFAAIFFPGCEMIEGIFKAGFWSALIAMLVLAALLYLIFGFTGLQTRDYTDDLMPQEKVSADK